MHLVFSGHFDNRRSPERIAFLERMLTSPEGRGCRFSVVNLSGRCAGNVTALNTREVTLGYGFSRTRLWKFIFDNRLFEYAGLPAGFSSVAGAIKLYRDAMGEAAETARAAVWARELLRNLEVFKGLLDSDKPDAVFFWNQFNAYHRLAICLARSYGVKVAFMHDGVLPGSIALDFDGEMGESWVSREPKRFLEIDVSDEEIDRAERFLDLLTEQRINRHQLGNQIDFAAYLERRNLSEKKIILCIGQNDWHAGIKPEMPRRQFHSPHFTSSVDMVEAVERVAAELDAHVIYKPHPNDKEPNFYLRTDDYSNLSVISHSSIEDMIDAATVVVTIASQASYIAAMRGKPCVLAGINQMREKGMTFDLQHRAELQSVLTAAMACFDVERQRAAMIKHMAQLEKSYLYDFYRIDHDFYTRGSDEAIANIRNELAR